MRYVCGFAYSEVNPRFPNEVHVLLLRKHKPDWQAGLLNGPGGKIEHAEGIRSAMAREFAEETGIATDCSVWSGFHIERWRSGAHVYFLHTQGIEEKLFDRACMDTWDTPEPVFKVAVGRASGTVVGSRKDLLYNVRYLLAMSRTLLALPADDRPLES